MIAAGSTPAKRDHFAGFAVDSAAAFTECPLNWRVKLNSPSLCPTMFSVTYTGMNFFPLCTANVCPTISGMIVERRDQVRTTFFSLRAFIPSTLARMCASMNGPFFVERAMFLLLRRYLLRRDTIKASVRLLLRVLYPRVGWPQGVTGGRPPEVLPSPPPCG